ncbi:sprouty RTK signaling antagonist 2 S homeolog isoform X1 [Xenopus laevis]|uniref:Protein sprouty homolog 2 n=2 Tax=Xenopus laevis TaxID=8355 RepID=Q90ZT6_XENLA|nr:sprouty RTK signaling antagonist 2 S homeolog [Xenopus laevis]XP_018103612.1 sprouty RTK signaling antagonist 2 S homeolog isoform X1 [Xenopus laevis]XP_018103613.1 sprouty RTK signaling antagonist 2 S homeolog isoform X1 [Xenopus laevis]AAI24886.1 LOC398313 protein [Xenopus laevis]AAK51356.1 sprouty2 [Xenopus laevis]AAM21293.1 sprouty 2 [Xenopus laevis]OCT92637.1 hypothetical protein XELAEV_18015695mg [Xenopus laevis]
METRVQNGNVSQPLLPARRDNGRLHSDTDPREILTQQVHVLSLEQIRAIRNSNEYTEGPTVAPRPVIKSAPRQTTQQKNERIHVVNEQRPFVRTPHAPMHSLFQASLSRSVGAASSSSRSNTRTSSSSSEQRLLVPPFTSSGVVADRIIRVQPKPELKSDILKPSSKEELDLHSLMCEDCGKCKCQECTYPRTLPSCWICDKQCLCSAQEVVDYGTCACCVKCLFYHCSNDDEDNCADNPCSCSQSHCCTRWSAIGVMALFLPCLWCYLPAKGCLKLCQGCYDRVNRPGCQCKRSNTVCLKVPHLQPRNLEKPT